MYGQTLDPLFLFLSTVWDMEKVKKKEEGKEVKLSVRPEKWLYIDSYSICIERSSFELGILGT